MDRKTSHLSNAELLQAIDGELTVSESERIAKHLDACWSCRGRRDRMAATISDFTLCRDRLLSPDLPPSPGGRAKFQAALAERALDASESTAGFRLPAFLRPSRLREPFALLRNPRLVTFAAVLLLVAWVARAPAAAAIGAALRFLAAAITDDAPAPSPPPPPISPLVAVPLPSIDTPAPAAPVRVAPARRTPRVNIVDLELEALWRLHQIGALVGEEITIARGDRGLSIRARVDTSERKTALQRALAPVADAGAQVRIETFSESVGPVTSTPPMVIVQQLTAVAEKSAASPLLTAHFVAQFGSEADPRVASSARDFSARTLRGARQIMLNAFAVKRVCEGLPASVLDQASDPARVIHQVLVREYAGAVETTSASLIRDLESLFGIRAEPVANTSEQAFIQLLATSAAQLEESIQSAFAVQAGAIESPAPDGDRLVNLARTIEGAASAIRQSNCQ